MTFKDSVASDAELQELIEGHPPCQICGADAAPDVVLLWTALIVELDDYNTEYYNMIICEDCIKETEKIAVAYTLRKL